MDSGDSGATLGAKIGLFALAEETGEIEGEEGEMGEAGEREEEEEEE